MGGLRNSRSDTSYDVFSCMQVEQASADMAADNEALSDLQEQLNRYSPENLYSADESTQQFRFSRNRTITSDQLSELKKCLGRITCLAGCKAAGSGIYALRIIVL